jgi:hypothetical protein
VRTKLSAGGLAERLRHGQSGAACCRGKLQSEKAIGNLAVFRVGLLNEGQP